MSPSVKKYIEAGLGLENFDWHNPNYPPLDAVMYAGIMSVNKPRKVIEVGAGASTTIATQYCDDVTAIDIAPLDLPAKFIHKPVQEVSISLFEQLKPKDILFIDSSHTYYPGSDVEFLLHKVLPRLKKGVWIHFHDFFLPDCPDFAREWNEQYAVEPLLKDPNYKVVVRNYTLSQEHKKDLEKQFKDLPVWDITTNWGRARGSSLWLVKK